MRWHDGGAVMRWHDGGAVMGLHDGFAPEVAAPIRAPGPAGHRARTRLVNDAPAAPASPASSAR
jgi:hypothetical protein